MENMILPWIALIALAGLTGLALGWFGHSLLRDAQREITPELLVENTRQTVTALQDTLSAQFAAQFSAQRVESERLAVLARETLDRRLAEGNARLAALTQSLHEDGAQHFATLRREHAEAFEQGRRAQAEGLEKGLQAQAVALENHMVTMRRTLADLGGMQHERLAHFSQQLQTSIKQGADQHERLLRQHEEKSVTLRTAVENRLADLQKGNEAKLEQMRATVDEKLQSTLRERLDASFKTVSDNLEKVQLGLGEMKTLASGVGDLKRVLTVSRERGAWGEMQLKTLLEQLLAPDQYGEQVQILGKERVDFAIRLPGQGNEAAQTVWVPIDAKFPLESYERLLRAHEAGEAEQMLIESRGLEQTFISMAKSISSKYINPPQTTDFAVLYLPTEGLFAEAMRSVGLADRLQREFRVTLAGPTTLAALLRSLQMGFRTLAVQQRSSEIEKILSRVKTEFGRFGEALDKTRKQLDTASRSLDEVAGTRMRAMERSLSKVESLPDANAPEAQPEQADGLLL